MDADLHEHILGAPLLIGWPIAARIRNPADDGVSGRTKVAMTASPIVFTTAPFSEEMISSRLEMRAHQIEGRRSPTRSYNAVEPLRSVNRKVSEVILRRWSILSVSA